jgi:hypothetical protein
MKQIISPLFLILTVVFAPSASADVFWNNNNGSAPGGDRSWGNAANWINGSPSAPGAGNAIINPWPNLTQTPIVDTLGNTANEIYLNDGAFFTVIEGGSLTSAALVTGQNNNSGEVQIAGGLFQTGNLLLGNGGFDGKLNISAGEVIANLLSINTSGGAFMNLGFEGKFTAPISNLNNVNFWIANNAILAENGAAGFSINVDTFSSPDNLVLTVLPEPGTTGLLGVAAILIGGVCVSRSLRQRKVSA